METSATQTPYIRDSEYLRALHSHAPADAALIASAAKMVIRPDQRASLLRTAADFDQHAAIASMLRQGFEIDPLAVVWAARAGSAKCLEAFLEGGADALMLDGEVLIEAAASGSEAALRCVLDGARGETPVFYASAALKAALVTGSLGCAQILLDVGFAPQEGDWEDLLGAAKMPGGRVAGHQVRLLQKHGLGTEQLEREAVLVAISGGDAEMLSFLLETGSCPLGGNLCFLRRAISENSIKIIDMLSHDAIDKGLLSFAVLRVLSDAGFTVEASMIEAEANGKMYVWPDRRG